MEQNSDTERRNAKITVRDFQNNDSITRELEPAKTRLHFLRYGFFQKKSKDDIGYALGGPENSDTYSVNEMDVSNGDIQSTDQFYVGRTSLRKGYIYLINDEDINDFIEIEVAADGKMKNILWQPTGDSQKPYDDIRPAEEEELPHLDLDLMQMRHMWVAFSPVQWTYDYHQQMLQDKEKRKEHMTLIDCGGIKKGEETAQEHALPHSELKIAHYKKHPNHRLLKNKIKKIENTEQKSDDEYYEDIFITLHDPIGAADDIADVLGIELTRQKALLEAMQTGRDLETVLDRMLENKAATLPNDEEQQIGAMVNLALTQYKLVYSNGEMIKEYGDLMSKPKILNLLAVAERKKLRELIKALQADLGNFLSADYYKEAYDAHELGSKLNLLDGKRSAVRFYKLLAIKSHMQDKSFDLPKDEEKDTTWDNLLLESLQEDNTSSSVYRMLNKVLDIDDDLTKDGRKEEVSEKIAAYVQETLETYAEFAMQDIIYTAKSGQGYSFSASAEDKGKQAIDLSNKSIAAIKGAGQDYVDQTKTTDIQTHMLSKTEMVEKTKTVTTKFTDQVHGSFEATLSRLNKLHVYGEDMFEVRTPELESQLHAHGWVIDESKVTFGKYAGKKALTRMTQQGSPELVLKESSHGRHIFDVPVTKEVTTEIQSTVKYMDKVTRNVPVDMEVSTLSKFGTKVDAVLDGAPFKGVVALFQAFNMVAAIHTYADKKDLKHGINLGGITFEFASATAYFYKKIAEKSLSNKSLRFLGRFALFTEAIGGGVTVAMCAWDAMLRIDARDYDAAAAWGGAAVAFAVSTTAGVFAAGAAVNAAWVPAVFAGSSWLGPIGWIAAAVGTGLVFLAYYFQDTPLEEFFKNNALSEEEDFNRTDEEKEGDYNAIVGYIKRFYASRAKLCPEEEYQKWNNFKCAGSELTDILISSEVNFKATEFFNEENSPQDWWYKLLGGPEIETAFIKRFEIAITFRQFLNSPEQFDYSFYFYKDGFCGTYEEMKGIKPNLKIQEATDKKAPQLIMDLDIPTSYTEQFNTNSIVLLVGRLSLGNGNHYPGKYDDTTRYWGGYFGVYRYESTITDPEIGFPIMTNIQDKGNVKLKTKDELLSGGAWEN